MICRVTAEELRLLAQQLDAVTSLMAAGGPHPGGNRVLTIDGKPLAYLHWNDSREEYMAEFLDFSPGNSTTHQDIVGELITVPSTR